MFWASGVEVMAENYSNLGNSDLVILYKNNVYVVEIKLDKTAKSALNQIKAKKYYEKYFYINHMWVGKVSTFEHYIKELVKMIGTYADTEAMLNNEEKDFKESIKKQKDLLKKLKINLVIK